MITNFYEFRHSPSNIIYISKYNFEFVGTGSNDMTINGNLIDELDFVIEIDGTDTPDTFKWSNDGGITWEAIEVSITGANQSLSNGISIRFDSTIGHTLGDVWSLAGNTSDFPLAWFITEETNYSLPANPPNIIWQWYKPNQFHNIYDGVNEFYLDIPWVEGDLYLSKKSLYDAAYAAYINVPPTLSEAKDIKLAQLQDYLVTRRSGGVVYSGNTYNSDIVSLNRLKSELDYSVSPYGGNGVVPVGYYVKNNVGTHISFTILDLSALVAEIEELHYLCRVPHDTHYENIQALTTVEDVEDYNFTTSPAFPTIPYNP